MSLSRNEHLIDRLIRIFIGTLLVGSGYFWVGGVAALIVIALGAVLIVTGAIGFCPLYSILSVNTDVLPAPAHTRIIIGVSVLLYVGLVIGGSYASVFFSNKVFLENFNQMDNAYKQTLFHTGQEDRDVSIADYQALMTTLDSFAMTYASYRPYTIRHDQQFEADIATIQEIVTGLDGTIREGDLHEAHLALETVRPILQDMLRRNGFSLLAVALIDFHDAMELMLDPADAHDSAGVLAAYPEANNKLTAVETEANDAEIQTIRVELEELRRLADEGQVDALPEQAAKLKASFVKVYLARG